ncbi:ribosome-associated translation inhibitor RaiA [Ichthyenterobacterium sp. W332]|uniref:Ribosome-associated translation inhibitor RaiA n=1 Tax=Microcosmobacter mediterraneus TaxID=3075607 RepID=A0ABU2YL15_9FLAO|nr:ribosome-associated translation inhibitor RaiA [Ichthyenterobacterium sp. W332]MDT0558863.1 ribosome-associated translation inhibitor RaiA [Ichthyenterobacterium sp. W332]
MTVNFEYHKIASSDRLEDFTKKKLAKLFDHNPFIIKATVYFKSENTESRDSGMICGIQLSVPGPLIFTESSKSTFEDAIQQSIKELKRQLERRKDKMKTH